VDPALREHGVRAWQGLRIPELFAKEAAALAKWRAGSHAYV